MNFTRTLLRTIVLSAVTIAALSFVGIRVPVASADALNCGQTVSDSQQQGAICLPSDPTGVSNSIPNQSVSGVIIQVIQIMLGFAAILAVFFVIIGGYRYIFDGGNDEQAEKGRKTVINALIGIVVILLSWTIVTVVGHTVGTGSGSGSSYGGSTTAAPSSGGNSNNGNSGGDTGGGSSDQGGGGSSMNSTAIPVSTATEAPAQSAPAGCPAGQIMASNSTCVSE